MEDASSVENYANWARKVGKTDEALQLSDKATAMKQEQGAAARFDAASGLMAQTQAQAQQGDVTALISSRDQFTKMSQAAPTLQEKQYYAGQAQQVGATIPAAQKIGLQNTVNSVNQVNELMGDEAKFSALPVEAQDALRTRQKTMMAQPGVTEAVGEKRLAEVKAGNEAAEANNKAQVLQIEKQWPQVKQQPPEVQEQWKKKQVEAGNGELVANLEYMDNQREAMSTSVALSRENAMKRDGKLEIPASVSESIKAMPAGERTDGITAAYKGLQDDILAYNNSRGGTSNASVGANITMENLTARMTKLGDLALTANTNQANINATELSRLLTTRESINRNMAAVSVPENVIKSRAYTMSGWIGDGDENKIYGSDGPDNWFRDTDSDEVGGGASSWYELARQELVAEKSASLQQAYNTTDEQIRALQSQRKGGVKTPLELLEIAVNAQEAQGAK
tara:strand:- start:836 stop:2194 length:1359 start_codon:yes stop_codon:yes gene_type:complete